MNSTQGEQGPRGEQGRTGLAGKIGLSGKTGERGQQGDHGQTGEPGAAGTTGVAGAAGASGSMGATGSTGITGKAGRILNRSQVLALFAFVVFAVILLAVRTEVNTEAIEKERRVSALADCESMKELLERLNEQQQLLAVTERTYLEAGTLLEPPAVEFHEARIVIYEQGIIPVPDCTN